MDRQAGVAPAIHLRSNGVVDRYPGRHFDCYDAHGYIPIHQHPGRRRDLVISGYEPRRHGEAGHHSFGARDDDDGE